VAISLVNAIALTAEVLALRQLLGLQSPIGFAELFAWVLGLSLVVYALVSGLILWARHAAEAAVSSAGPALPDVTAEGRFLRRLPPHKRGDLHCLRTEDHYLRVYTVAGEALILLRLKDALRELEGCDGAQVHRSFWVARPAVREAYRRGRKWRLRLSNGLDVPVSERFVPALREAGWLG
jgi:DNA-binding LytR/AlgR family response regulator